MRPSRLIAIGAGLLALTAAVAVRAQRTDAFVESRDHPAIQYSKGHVQDRVSVLNRRLDDGAVQLVFDPATGYLRSALGALGIPVESQVAVYSPTSSQADLINRKNPRAVYFTDDVAVGWVRGGTILEVAAQDLRQGVIFYSLDQTPAGKPRFRRSDGSCLLCHLTWDTLGVPGMLVFHMFPLQDRNAYANGFATDHRTPFPDRWGGWYVTGTLGALRRHMGNIPLYKDEAPGAREGGLPPQLTSLDQAFDATGYLTRHSDVVALMVLEHQSRMVNLITRVGWETRVGGNVTPRVAGAVSDLVDYMLFVDETPLPGKIQGLSGFTEKFSAGGPRDSKGRSLRQLDLDGRLMRYPCSYMIYTEAFDAMPDASKEAVYKRLWQVLSGQDKQAKYARIPLRDRQAVVEILRDTKKNLPAYFQPLTR